MKGCKFAVNDSMELVSHRKTGPASDVPLKGIFRLTHKDINGKVLSDTEHENLVTNEGFDYILDSSLHAATNVSIWYFALYGTAFTASVSSTYASPGGTELIGYNEGTRQEWGEGASSSQSVTNASAATITSTGALEVLGIGIVGSPTGATDDDGKGDIACSDAILLSEVAATKTLAAGETLDITYTLSKT